MRVQALVSELRRLGRSRELRDYIWWSAQDKADHANGQLAEALRQLRAGDSPTNTFRRKPTWSRPPRTRQASAQEDT